MLPNPTALHCTALIRCKPQPGLQNNPSHRGVMGLAHLIPALLVLTLLLGACSKKKEETDDTTCGLHNLSSDFPIEAWLKAA